MGINHGTMCMEIGCKEPCETNLDRCRAHEMASTGSWEMSTKENILQEADRLTSGDRRKDYGHPSIQFERLSKLWSVILGVEVTPMQVALCLIQLKVSRQMNGHHRDSLVDIAGYARVAEMLTE